MKKKKWGQHLILDIADCNDKILCKESLAAFVKELAKAIDMVTYGEPLIEHFAAHSQEAAGFSLVQLIETSAITGHFSDNNRDAYLDIFSCKAFDQKEAVRVVDKHFAPKSIYALFLNREAKLPPEKPFQQIK